MADKNEVKACFRTTIGGQALIEGIMMRGPEKTSIVVRKEDKTLAVKTESYVPRAKKNKIWGIPVIRGFINFVDSMATGMKALFYSADVAFEAIEEEKPGFLEKKLGKEKADGIYTTISLIFGVAIPIVLFFMLPTLITGLVDDYIGSGFLRNLLEGLIRILIFLAFMFSVSRMKDIRRTFMYHGAEHKTIHCYEAGQPLTVENVRKCPKEHPRCGTSFLFVVMIISILLFAVVTWSNPLVRVALRLAMLPLVVAISYEFNRYVGRHDNAMTHFLRAPGLWMQKLTTFEPDDSMIEIAIEALKNVIPEEKGSDAW